MDGVVHPNVEQAIGRDRIRKALKRYENRPADEHRYGIVRSVNEDGSYEVLLDGDVQTSRCAQYGTALVGDRVLAVTKKDGRNDLIGRLGGEIGGGGTVVTKVDDVSNYVAGRVFAHAGTNDPAGALLCDGRAVSRREYWELFDAIGTTYGAGDGSSTFNLPNIESRTIIGESDSYALGSTGGEETHKLTEGELPKLSGRAWFRNWTWGSGSQGSTFLSPDGILKSESGGSTGYDLLSYGSAQGGSTIFKVEFGGDQPHNNMQPYIVMRYFITTGKGDPVSGINPADYVVEWGKDETWTWVKYASGMAECWGGYSDWFNVSTEWSGFYYGSFDAIEYPFEFTNAPYEWVTFRAGSNAMYVSPVVNSTTKTHHGYLYCPKSTPSINGWLFFHAKGFWKDSPASGGTETIAPTIAERFEKIEAMLKTETVQITEYADGWTNYGSSGIPAIRRCGNVVTLSGAMKPTASVSLTTNEATMFTIPEEYAPPETVYGGIHQGSGINRWQLVIGSSGNVNASRYGTDAYTTPAAGAWFPFYATWVIE